MTGERLAPCPFCGKEPKSSFYGDEDGGYHGIDCCHAFAHEGDETEAIAAWSTRSLPAALDRVIAEVEAMRKIHSHFAYQRPLRSGKSDVDMGDFLAMLRALRAEHSAGEGDDGKRPNHTACCEWWQGKVCSCGRPYGATRGAEDG